MQSPSRTAQHLRTVADRYERDGDITAQRLIEWTPGVSASFGGGRSSGDHSDPTGAAVESARVRVGDLEAWNAAHADLNVLTVGFGCVLSQSVSNRLRAIADILEHSRVKVRVLKRLVRTADTLYRIMANCAPTVQRVRDRACKACERELSPLRDGLCNACRMDRDRKLSKGVCLDEGDWLKGRRLAIETGMALADADVRSPLSPKSSK